MSTTLYRMFDGTGQLLYVGISSRAATRFKEHSADKPWWNQVALITTEHFGTRLQAQTAELAAIASEHPIHNIVGQSQEPLAPIGCPPIAWGDGMVESYEFSTIITDQAYLARSVNSGWVELLIDYRLGHCYRGHGITDIASTMAELHAAWWGAEWWTSSNFTRGDTCPTIRFPGTMNDWFTRMALESESGGYWMATLTRRAINRSGYINRAGDPHASEYRRHREAQTALTRMHKYLERYGVPKLVTA